MTSWSHNTRSQKPLYILYNSTIYGILCPIIMLVLKLSHVRENLIWICLCELTWGHCLHSLTTGSLITDCVGSSVTSDATSIILSIWCDNEEQIWLKVGLHFCSFTSSDEERHDDVHLFPTLGDKFYDVFWCICRWIHRVTRSNHFDDTCIRHTTVRNCWVSMWRSTVPFSRFPKL